MLTNEQISVLKNKLIEERENIKGELDANEGIGARETQRESTGELSAYDNHPADMATELYEREKDMALSVHEQDQLNDIEDALNAIDSENYGKCTECGKDIPFERLEAIPYTLTCVEHSGEGPIPNDRPVEEEYIKPAVDNSFSGRDQREGIRDYEDSFQEVAKYGTSETPSDFEGDYDSYGELYQEKIADGFTEEYEMFTGNDITGNNREVFQTEKEREYEDLLDDVGTDTTFGDLPYKNSDGYVDKKKED